MQDRIARLAAFTEVVASRRTHDFDGLVKAAYAAGATREDLLTAVKLGRFLGEVSGPVVALAHAAVHEWQWMVARRLEHRRELASHLS